MANRLDEDISLVRTNYFGTIPPRGRFNTSKQYAFYDFLERSCDYETEIHEVDVGTDENWIKMSLASSLLYYAAQLARSISPFSSGTIRTTRPSCAGPGSSASASRLSAPMMRTEGTAAGGDACKPFARGGLPLLWIDDHASEVRLVRERVTRVCKQCGREEETTWAGPEFFCVACRGRHRK